MLPTKIHVERLRVSRNNSGFVALKKAVASGPFGGSLDLLELVDKFFVSKLVPFFLHEEFNGYRALNALRRTCSMLRT